MIVAVIYSCRLYKNVKVNPCRFKQYCAFYKPPWGQSLPGEIPTVTQLMDADPNANPTGSWKKDERMGASFLNPN